MANTDAKAQNPSRRKPLAAPAAAMADALKGSNVVTAETKGRKTEADLKLTAWIKDARFFILALIVVSVAILMVFNVISKGIESMLLAEKSIEKQLEINLIAEQTDMSVEKYDDWDTARDHYLETLLVSVELIDKVHMTYAAVFDEDLNNLSARSPSYEGSPFEPMLYTECVDAVKTSARGELVLPFAPPGSKERDMHLQFQWIPSDPALPNRVLAVVAISRYTVSTRISTWVQTMAVAFVVVAFIVAFFLWRRRIALSVNKTLEDTVRLRTIELVEQTAAANQASMAKSNFLSNMSHEMRTPMNAIIGMTTIAKNAEDIERKDYCLAKIEDASTHLLSVINDILDMSKIEAKKFELSIEKFNFERLLQKVANVIVYHVDAKHQTFTVHIDEDIPMFLLGDDQRMMQVITNLMSNAVKFTPEYGSISLNAYLLENNKGKCKIQIEVTDTGIGISDDQRDKLFRSFVQAETSTTRKFGGTGLGLSISKHIVEMMGGTIWVESELGKGSTFAFTMQAEQAYDNNEGLLDSSINWENMSVLVVDDAFETREYFSEIMQRFGSHCDVAASGDEACLLIERNGPYNLYFVDWRMEGMDGIELARRIDTDGDGKSVVIMISANEWNEVEGDARGAGISRFLSKPLFPSMIADCINECLGTGSILPNEREISYRGILSGYRILLAEDVEVNREIVLSLLEPTELIIDQAENGLVAYEMFRDNPELYDMIFMDVQMPEMDGYDSTRNIRALGFPKAHDIPIVAMTANVFREDVEKCIESGMNDHIGKPIDYEKMISKLCGYLFTHPRSDDVTIERSW